MKAKTFLYLLASLGLLVLAISLLSALVTATGAFNADPGARVNRIDFVWAVVGLVVAAASFLIAQKMKPQS